jgi:hypothetical protein
VAVYSVDVAVFFTMTVAPGMMPPDGSATIPLNDDVAPPPWANAAALEAARHANVTSAHTSRPNARCLIGPPDGLARKLANERRELRLLPPPGGINSGMKNSR